MIVLLLIPLAAALIAMPIVKRAPIHGALLAGWAALTFLGFAPGGLFAASGYLRDGNVGGIAIVFVSLSGFVVSICLLVRLSRLYRGEALGSSMYLVGHHVAVVLAFLVAEVVRGEGLYLTAFCAVACAIGALITGYDAAKLPARPPQPVAF